MTFDIKKLQESQKARLEAGKTPFDVPEWKDFIDGPIIIKPVPYSVIAQYIKTRKDIGEHQAAIYLALNGIEGFNTIEHSKLLNGEAAGTVLKIAKEINRVSGIE